MKQQWQMKTDQNRKFYHDCETDTFTFGTAPAGFGSRYTEFYADGRGVHSYEAIDRVPCEMRMRATVFGGETLKAFEERTAEDSILKGGN